MTIAVPGDDGRARHAHQIWKTGQFLSNERLIAAFKELFPDSETVSGSSTETQIFRIRGYAGKMAFIPSYTRSLCGDCDRIRLGLAAGVEAGGLR